KNNWKYGMRISGEYYTGNELATLAKFVLARNSWRHWHKEKSAWLDQDINEISRKYGYDAGIFSQMMHYDICPDISCIADKKIRKEVFRRERELVVNF
ncbi:MAG TPA: hypothetical protein VJC17_00585, partial [Candidatus Dojkabacteria bacterium]|nr:hypothetical protein [Candidatus Dojkabacteria bacterium]